MLNRVTHMLILGCLIMTIPTNVRALDRQLEKTLVSFGYKITGKISAAAADWELRDFKMVRKTIYNIKSTRSVPGKKYLYYRFSIKVEEFATVEDAGKRAAHIDATTPGPDSKMIGPEYDLREGFQHGTKVYVISTAVYEFVADKSLSQLRKRLDREIRKNAKCRDSFKKCS